MFVTTRLERLLHSEVNPVVNYQGIVVSLKLDAVIPGFCMVLPLTICRLRKIDGECCGAAGNRHRAGEYGSVNPNPHKAGTVNVQLCACAAFPAPISLKPSISKCRNGCECSQYTYDKKHLNFFWTYHTVPPMAYIVTSTRGTVKVSAGKRTEINFEEIVEKCSRKDSRATQRAQRNVRILSQKCAGEMKNSREDRGLRTTALCALRIFAALRDKNSKIDFRASQKTCA